MGYNGVCNFLAAMDIPPLSETTYKRKEREVGPAFEKVAGESMKAAQDDEEMMSRER